MKRFKNRKNVKNVNNTVKNNANMDGFEELVNAAKEFKGALDDEVANREYERKKLAETKEFKELMELQEEALRSIGGFSEVIIHSLEPWGRAMTYGELYRQETAKTAMQAVEDIINPVTEEKREKSKKNKPASEVESLKAELENLNAHFKGVCAERDRFERCLKSAENALAYKDKVIERIKKKNAKRMSEKCEVIAVLNKEIEFQNKRRVKAEKFVNTLGQAFDLLKKNVEDYEHSIGR
ncbi:hypothetical protein [Prevotella sp.]|uniref:hypothetical protein n=1 Tax=Prevotella sp. TaxID=59823 RepID=UPI003AB5B78F